MATFLFRLGRLAHRRRHFVLLIWIALLALAGFGASAAPPAASSSSSVPGTEAQRAFDLLDERFPGSTSGGATARIVFRAEDGGRLTAPDAKSRVGAVVAALRPGSGQLESASDPFTAGGVSKDGTVAYSSLTYKVTSAELTDATRDALKESAVRAERAGLVAEIGGDALAAQPETGPSEIIGVLVAAMVLVITFGSLLAAGLPLLTAIIGVGIGVSTITALAHALDLGTTTSTLAMMLGLAVGIDYALFVVSRYRAELAAGHARDEAAGRAVGTAGAAVVFAGLTVIIALAGLAVVNIPMLTKMGIAAAGTVAVAVLIALTLIPALLGYAGKRVHGRRARRAMAQQDGTLPVKDNAGTRWARFVLRHRVALLLAGVLGLGVVALPVASLKVGMPDGSWQPPHTTQRKAYDLLSDAFGPGFNGPLVTVVDARAAQDPKAAVADVERRIGKLDGIARVNPARFNKAGDTATIIVVPSSKPSSTATEDLVHALRDESGAVRSDTGARLLVTGATAMNIDVSQKLSAALPPYLALVGGLAFLLLMLVFRSVLVPLKAALGFLLSVVAALGAVVAVYQWGWLSALFGVEQTGPVMSMMPIFLVAVVFGLAMDYEVFLVTRMREVHVHGASPEETIVAGFRHGTRVVTAAAVIMMAVFAGFIGSSEQMVKMIGFGLATAVLFDAFVVRMTIVPAVLGLLGARAWWLPGWLDRLLPNVDVEGESLHRRLAARADTTADPDQDSDKELIRG
ncbi:MMPL family transporter [Streptomyces pseudovenezuelae]|uniref:MMPL family transporter n=1 Tax=Streptomyces pseudovenezuelae TaxID=67350 RepID=UPI002E34D7EB|nr:MMPL family transporter [Streptomyces pseudovenezuelae]